MPKQPDFRLNLRFTDECPWCTNQDPRVMFSGLTMRFEAECISCGKHYEVKELP